MKVFLHLAPDVGTQQVLMNAAWGPQPPVIPTDVKAPGGLTLPPPPQPHLHTSGRRQTHLVPRLRFIVIKSASIEVMRERL